MARVDDAFKVISSDDVAKAVAEGQAVLSLIAKLRAEGVKNIRATDDWENVKKSIDALNRIVIALDLVDEMIPKTKKSVATLLVNLQEKAA